MHFATIKGAAAHHVYEEEGKWFLDVKSKLSAADQAKLTERYSEQFSHYMSADAPRILKTG